MKKMNLSPRALTALIVSVAGFVLNLGIKYNNVQDPYLATMASVVVIETIILLIVGLVMLASKEVRPIAQGILIGLGINLVIGFSVCTML